MQRVIRAALWTGAAHAAGRETQLNEEFNRNRTKAEGFSKVEVRLENQSLYDAAISAACFFGVPDQMIDCHGGLPLALHQWFSVLQRDQSGDHEPSLENQARLCGDDRQAVTLLGFRRLSIADGARRGARVHGS